ncbi:MAG: Tfp pilus assembly protein FimT/FimU [Kiritimatiellia bacterium]
MCCIRHRYDTAGFTILEVVAVLLLMGVLASVAIPRVMDAGYAVTAEAEVLRANLRFAQSVALAANTAQWSIHFAGNTYTLQRNGATSSVRFPGQSSATHVLGNGVQVTGGTGTLVFNTFGAPALTYVITLSNAARTESVVVTGFTGLVP